MTENELSKFRELVPIGTRIRLCWQAGNVDIDQRPINPKNREGRLVDYGFKPEERVAVFKHSIGEIVFQLRQTKALKIMLENESDPRPFYHSSMDYFIERQWKTFDEIMS